MTPAEKILAVADELERLSREASADDVTSPVCILADFSSLAPRLAKALRALTIPNPGPPFVSEAQRQHYQILAWAAAALEEPEP